ncbi:hypothetical protein BEL04_04765 [Mucilaginibacter sp. PPCGB 2223]|nr:hypothetical protein BEL04_04765 [Mucilaginibacter sp. PPCGB 2223]
MQGFFLQSISCDTKKPLRISQRFLISFQKKVDYIFFLVVSAIFILAVSFLVVSFLVLSAAILAAESALAVESAAEVDFLPEQEAKETAKAKAKAPNLIEFFIFFVLK